jgi:uncharacterized protein DUF6152
MNVKVVLVCSIPLVLVTPALAHHSAAAYDTQRQITVTGAVTQYRFANPHVYLTLQLRNSAGSATLVQVEAGAASVLNPLGFKKDSLAIGDMVTIKGNPSKNNPDISVLGLELYKSDGTYYPLNIGSRSTYVPGNQTATSIAGTWFSPRTEFNGFLNGVAQWPVTEKGKAAMAHVVDPKASTQKDCIPIGAPALMFYPVANTITVERDRVLMKVDWLDSERTIYTDGRKHPAANQTFLQGHSIGRWEGDTLIAETTNFKEHPMGFSAALPSSSQKRLTERFRLSPDRKSLIYSGVIEDPVYLSRPVEWSGQWQYRPNMPHSNQKCDLEVARKFLTE